ncbi:hypothetical protein ES703_17445 [subsurface metagenome]
MNKDIDELRRDVSLHLADLVDQDGFSPRLISAHCGIHYRRLYRWLALDMFLPPLKACHAIIDLAKKVERVKADFSDIVVSWNDDRYSRITMLGLIAWPYLQVLENKSLDPKGKVKKLTLQVFKDWARSKDAR